MRKKKGSGLPVKTTVLLGLSVGCLTFSAVGSTRAALSYYSETYSARIDMQSIGVTLVENDRDVSYRDYTHADDEWDEATGTLFTGILREGEAWKPGEVHREELGAKNSGNIDEYVRIKVYKYWVDQNGRKVTELSPALICLEMPGNGWIIDEKASTAKLREGDDRDGEMVIAYYSAVLAPGESTLPFTETISVDGGIAEKVTETVETGEDGRTTITTTYDYNGVNFMLEVEVDAVQTHNAVSAIRSAWGVDVEVAEDGSLSLRN